MNDDKLLDPYHLVEQLTEAQVKQLYELTGQQWWGGERSLEDVRIMIENTPLMIGLVERSSQRLIGYSRVLTDFVFRATVYDVMVDQEFQGRGLGNQLLDAICNHPQLQRVSLIYLACEPDLFPFYERWGFAEYEGRAEWMIKVQREE